MQFANIKKTVTADALEAVWNKVDVVVAGTDALRKHDQCPSNCTTFLPQEECETDPAYSNKLSRAIMPPFYRNALLSAVGVVCGTGVLISVGEEETDFDEDFISNVDGVGSTLEMFVRELNFYQMHHGIAFCYIDSPAEEALPNDPHFDEHRPYLTLVKATDLIEMEHRRLGAADVMTLLAWEYKGQDENNSYKKQLHIVIRDDECEEEEDERYSEYAEGDVVWTTTTVCNGKEEVDTGVIEGLDRLPIVAVTGKKEDSYLGSPVFEDQCDMAIEWYRMNAALQVNLYMTSAPMLVFSGQPKPKKQRVDEEVENPREVISVGPNKAFWLEDPEAKVLYLEHSGNGATSISEYLRQLEDMMDKEIANFTVDQSQGPVTATETVTNTVEVKSLVETVKDSLVAGINDIIQLYKQMDGSDNTETYVVSITENIQALLDPTNKAIVTELFEQGLITHSGYLETLQQFLSDDIQLLGMKSDGIKPRNEDETENGGDS